MIDLTVRASSLSQFADCPRRWAAKHIRGMVVQAGFHPRTLPSSVGAVIGSGTHSATAFDLEHKMRTGDLARFVDAEAVGIGEMEERIEKEGVIFDDVSQDVGAAAMQVRRLARTYREDVSDKITPAFVERRLKAKHATGLTVSGQADIFIEAPNGLRDLKTGKRIGANFAQYGIYARLLRSHGRPVASVTEDFGRRVALSSTQPRIVSIPYDIDACEMQAEQTLQRVARDVAAFEKTGDREVFAANPASGLCSDKYCAAHSTGFCTLGRKL